MKRYYGDVTVLVRARRRISIDVNADQDITKSIVCDALNEVSDVAFIVETHDEEDFEVIEVENLDLDECTL